MDVAQALATSLAGEKIRALTIRHDLGAITHLMLPQGVAPPGQDFAHYLRTIAETARKLVREALIEASATGKPVDVFTAIEAVGTAFVSAYEEYGSPAGSPARSCSTEHAPSTRQDRSPARPCSRSASPCEPQFHAGAGSDEKLLAPSPSPRAYRGKPDQRPDCGSARPRPFEPPRGARLRARRATARTDAGRPLAQRRRRAGARLGPLSARASAAQRPGVTP